MGLWKSLLAALWLDLGAVKTLLTGGETVGSRRLFVRPFVSASVTLRPFVSGLLSAMARTASSFPLDRLKRLLFFRSIQEGENPRKLFSIPIVQVRRYFEITVGMGNGSYLLRYWYV